MMEPLNIIEIKTVEYVEPTWLSLLLSFLLG